MIFNNKKYNIQEKFFRSKEGSNQILVSDKQSGSVKVEKRRVFYIVEREGTEYWVKEYVDRGYGNIIYEFDETCRLRKFSYIDSNNISTIKIYELEANRLLIKYYKDYYKFKDLKGDMSLENKKMLKNLIELWISESDIRDYDLSENNVLIKTGKYMSVRLLDFEYSFNKNKKQWKEFLGRI